MNKGFLIFLLFVSFCCNIVLFLGYKELSDGKQEDFDRIHYLNKENGASFSMFRLYMTLYVDLLTRNLYSEGAIDKEEYDYLTEINEEQIRDRKRDVNNDELFKKMMFYPLRTNMTFSENRYQKGVFKPILDKLEPITNEELNNTNLGFDIQPNRKPGENIGNLIFLYKNNNY